jgi:hypothetical protein
MQNPPILFVVTFIICGILLAIRNIYFFKIWMIRKEINDDEVYMKIFRAGPQKFMMPIVLPKKITDHNTKRLIKKLNIFNYLAILLFIISIVVFVSHVNKTSL